jgi:hypothetical protein
MLAGMAVTGARLLPMARRSGRLSRMGSAGYIFGYERHADVVDLPMR